MEKTVTYPQYRKYPTDQAYFKILSDQQWEEIQFIGSQKKLTNYQVKILPDRNYIYDLTFDYHNNWEKITAEEYEKIKSTI